MDNNFNNGNFDPNQTQPVDMGMTQPAGAGMTQPVDAGFAQPADAGMTQPVNTGYNQPMDAGMTQPVNTGYNQPMDAGMTQPVNTGYNQPMDAGMTQPVNTGYNQPMDAGMTQPVNTGYNQPMDAGMTQPVNTGYNQPMDAGMTQPVNTGYNPSMNPGMTQPVSPDMSNQFAQINQQNMQQFGGSQFNQTANNIPQTGGKKPKKPKKPLSGGAIAGIITACAALVALVVCGIIFIPKMFKSPKDKVKAAFEKTFDRSDEAVEVNNKLIEEGGEVKLAFKSDQIAGQDFPAEFNLDMIYAPKDKLVNSDLNIKLSGDDILVVKLIGTEDETYIAVPDLIKGYFALPNKDFGATFANSPLGQAMGIDASQFQDVSFNYFDISTEKAADGKTIFDKIWDKSEVKKDGKKSISVNGKTVKAKKYIVTIPKDAILDELETTINEYMGDYAEQYGLSTSDLRTALSTVLGGDIVANVYVKDDKVVKIECKNEAGMINYNIWLDYDSDAIAGECTLSAMGSEVSIKLDVKDPEGNPNGTISFTAPGTSIVVKFDSTVVDKSDEKSADINLEVAQNDEVFFKGSVSLSENLNNKTAANIDDSETVYDVCIMTEEDLTTLLQDNMYAINEWITKISQNEILAQIFGGYGGDIIDYDDLDDDDNDDDDDDDDDDDISEDDMTLESYNGDKVTILGSLPGFECDYACDYFIDFGKNDYSASIEYSLENYYESAQETAESIYIPEDSDTITYEVVEQELGTPIEFEGETIYCSKVHYIQKGSSGYTTEQVDFMFVREIGEGLFLKVDVYVYPESEFFGKGFEDLVSVISSEYYVVE